MRADTMCHHYESNPEWEALVEKRLRTEFEDDGDGSEESPNRADPPLADD